MAKCKLLVTASTATYSYNNFVQIHINVYVDLKSNMYRGNMDVWSTNLPITSRIPISYLLIAHTFDTIIGINVLSTNIRVINYSLFFSTEITFLISKQCWTSLNVQFA